MIAFIITVRVTCTRSRKEKKRKEKKSKDYAFWRQFNEKPSIIPGCPRVPGQRLACQILVAEVLLNLFLFDIAHAVRFMITATCKRSLTGRESLTVRTQNGNKDQRLFGSV